MRGVAVLFLPSGDLFQYWLDGFAVADQIVIDHEEHRGSSGPQLVEFLDDLAPGLVTWFAAKGDDDVAELALEWAAARDL